MCTVTVLREPSRLLVTMNRDERWRRAPERRPTDHTTPAGIRWSGPTDTARGGTWIGASEQGVVGCLLNGYAPEDLELLDRPDVPSRGEIIPALLDRPADTALEWLGHRFDPTPYPSFVVLAFSPAGAVRLSWKRGTGARTTPIGDGWTMFSSSFWRTAEVLAWRRDRFRAWRAAGAPTAAGVPTYNLAEEPGMREWSPLMTRPESATRSISQVDLRLADGTVDLRWWPRRSDAAIDPMRPGAALRFDVGQQTTSPPRRRAS